jgi:hypothetical protein
MIDSIILTRQTTMHESEEFKEHLQEIPRKQDIKNRNQIFYKYENKYFNDNLIVSLIIKNSEFGFNFSFIKIWIRSLNDLLDMERVNDKHYYLIENKLEPILRPFKLCLDDFKLKEIHYKCDIKTTEKERREYLNILKRGKEVYNLKRYTYSDNDNVKYKNKSIEITGYCKNTEMQIKPLKFREHLKDILRIEIKVKKEALNSIRKKMNKERTLKNFFTLDIRDLVFNKYLFERVLGNYKEGNYFNLNVIKDKLKDKESKLKSKILKALKELQKNNLNYMNDKHSKQTLNKYFEKELPEGVSPFAIYDLDILKGLGIVLDEERNLLLMFVPATPTEISITKHRLTNNCK